MAREGLLRYYRRHLLKDVRYFLRKTLGEDWFDIYRGSVGASFNGNLEAARDIIWRSTQNNWFEYPMGSRLKFFHYPIRYRNMARDGVPIMCNGPCPTSKQARSMKIKPEEKNILKQKLLQIIEKRYLTIPNDTLESWIKYFSVSKGVSNGVV